MSEERFNQEIGADFTDFVGRVFKDFDEETHVTDLEYDPRLPTALATDYGWTNPFVGLIIQWDVFDNVYVIGEYREVNRDINDIVRDLQAWPLARQATELYPEPAGPGDTAILAKELRLNVRGNTGGMKRERIELIRQWLRLMPEDHPIEKRTPKLLVDRKCTGLIREMLDYRYPDTREESVRANSEDPLDKDDHGPEALGRFMRGHFGSPLTGRSRPRQRKAVISSGRR
jgi:hypothetical protein